MINLNKVQTHIIAKNLGINPSCGVCSQHDFPKIVPLHTVGYLLYFHIYSQNNIAEDVKENHGEFSSMPETLCHERTKHRTLALNMFYSVVLIKACHEAMTIMDQKLYLIHASLSMALGDSEH
jgi:hypothetical protein